MKRKHNIFITLILCLITMHAWAATETKTATWYLNAGTSGTTTLEDKWTLLSGEGKRLCYNNSIKDDDNCIQYSREKYKTTYFKGNIISNNGELVFTNIEGTVTKVEMSMLKFYYSGMQMYVGLDKGNNSTLLHLQGNNNDFDYSSTDSDSEVSATFEGSIDVSTGNPLKIMFSGNSESGGNFCFKDGYITVTYEVESQSSQDPGHSFTFNVNGNTLTATCNSTDVNHTCNLTDRKSTLVLDIDDVPYNGQIYIASFNLGDFIENTGLTVVNGGIKYVNRNTGEERANGVYEEGSYTASVTISINDNDYQLSKDFDVYNSKPINNSYRQISLSKNVANKHDIITITFTPRSHELVNTLTVTGATTDMSIGNGITKVDEYTYTFTMPFEEVTIGATFKSSDASLYKYTITTDITGSGAVDYNAEEYLGVGDAITITFMPYLQGNLEAGSVVLEGLTVTGATTNMSVGNGITDNGDNTYTFTMPGENVTVTAKAYLSADAILAGTINEPIYIKQGNGIQIGCNNIWTYVNDGALPLVIPDGNTLRLAGGTDVRLDLADKNAIACEGDAIVELIPNEVSNEIWIGDRPERNSGKATIKVGPAGKTLTIRVADESTETVHLSVKSISQYDRNCDVIGCDESGSCGSIVVESGQVESREYFNHSGRAFRTTDGTITFGYKYPNDKIYFDGGSEGTVKIEDGKQFHSYTDYNTKYSGTINLQGMNSFDARPDKYTVNYCEHDGQNQKVRYVAHGMPFSFKAATPADEGHEFQGWKNMVTDEVYEHDFIVTNDLNIIAQWKAVDFQKKGNLAKASEEDEAFYWSTFYCDDATYRLGEKACAYTATYDGGQIVLHKLGTVIPADKAVVIASENELTDMTVVAGDTPAEYEVENDLKGYDYRYYVDAQNSSVAYYVLGKYKNAEDGVEFGFQRYQGDYLPAHKAFLNAGGAANARGLRMVFAAEDITGIENLNMNVSERNDTWYTLDGRKLDKKPTTRGIYINRGNKVVIK
ncbi:hypothetical protein SAMN04487900_10844 [Prevotella communis]|uniref:Uncharacterized protein n=1 Tax=Prevotella communis TaxID=2913614 RepID=A0A1H0GB57_9BACT|nr:hypothetical protein SAMN04487900_10844 [Prevotella communis]